MKTIEMDMAKKAAEEPDKGHNRWHPDVTPVVEVEQGEEVALQCRDALDGQLRPGSTAADLKDIDRGVVHPLTGPVYVKGARPGDLLEIEIRHVEPARWGFTSILPAFGFLRDLYLEPFLVKWDIDGKYATSPDLPGVRVPNGSFMGTIGVAPSRELLEEATRRERETEERGEIALPPDPAGAVPSMGPVASEGLRTMPPRENGGNLDIKQLTAGTRLLCPVFVEGALFSVGDGHFAQGDSECCGTAVEMSATPTVRFNVREGDAERRGIRFPMFEADDYFISPEMAAPKRFLATTGMPIRDGRNESENVTLAARQALVNMIDVLVDRGWSREQAYVICSVAVDMKLSEVVDLPNVVVSAFLPLDIFQD